MEGNVGQASGVFRQLRNVAFEPNAAANFISVAEALNRGCTVVYSSPDDVYTLGVFGSTNLFSRKYVGGKLSSHYTCDMTAENALITTVANNMRNYTPREVSQARAARQLMLNLAHASSAAIMDMLDSGIVNCTVTKMDIRNADAIFGPSIPSLKGKTAKQASAVSPNILAPRVTQVEQVVVVDVFFVKKLQFLIGVLSPLELSFCVQLKNRGVECMSSALTSFLSTASSRGFDCVLIKSDGEGAIGAMSTALKSSSIHQDQASTFQL